MLSHDEILAALEQEFPRGAAGQPPDGVFLVARLQGPGARNGEPTPYVFIPDIHLVPAADADRFRWVTARESQVDALVRLAKLLGRLRGLDPSLRVWQLGDCVDLWRTGGIGGTVGRRCGGHAGGPGDPDQTRCVMRPACRCWPATMTRS